MKNYLVYDADEQKLRIVEENMYKDTYELLRNNVNGCIECVSWIKILYERNIDIWINEEGKLLDLPPSIIIVDDKSNIIGTLNGNIVFAKNDNKGATIPLNDEDILFIKKIIEQNKCLIDYNQSIMCVPFFRYQ
ncbi:DUF3846 domain-containing protein [Thomasclavelia spiroformis]|uniref:DUF3846 domain-containing protein n=1 Tax=Thomasclavelia spiroformis TaxID=29348 RepID=UPI0024B2649E|nr:DUF3846 domain-containing protein [Thomasclavelia spiroformis]